MTYITNTDIENFLGTLVYVQLTDDTGTGSADTNKVSQARLGAEGEVNSYLATRYQAPVNISAEAETGEVIKTFVLSLAAYRLHSRRPPVPADIVRRHDEALVWLSRVAAGIVQLPSTVALPITTSLGLVSDARIPTRQMTRAELEDV